MKPKYIVLAGGIVMVIGSLLPWVTKTLTIPASDELPAAIFRWSEAGIDNLAGLLTLALGVMIILAGLVPDRTPRKFHNALTGVLSLLAGIITIFGLSVMTDMTSHKQHGYTDADMNMSLGIGLLVLTIGILTVLLGSFTHTSGTKLTETTAVLAQ
jgi:uncharacterized protein YjeT (DUF2065 family)